MKDSKVTTFTERNTMYNLFPLMARTAVVCVVPKAIDMIHDAFFKTKKAPSNFEKMITVPTGGHSLHPVEEKVKSKIPRKKSDTSPFYKEHFDYVNWQHKEFTKYNANRKRVDRQTQAEFIKELNKDLGMDKSPGSYRILWDGTIKRSSLKKARHSIFADNRANPVKETIVVEDRSNNAFSL